MKTNTLRNGFCYVYDVCARETSDGQRALVQDIYARNNGSQSKYMFFFGFLGAIYVHGLDLYQKCVVQTLDDLALVLDASQETHEIFVKREDGGWRVLGERPL